MRQRFVHETAVETADGMGGVVRSFIPVDALWGAIESSASRSDLDAVADRPVAVLTHRVTLRGRSEVAPGDRLRLGARRLVVGAVHDPDGRGRIVECLCTEETP
nr:phage head closure protein [Ancylobacter crimeensis]